MEAIGIYLGDKLGSVAELVVTNGTAEKREFTQLLYGQKTDPANLALYIQTLLKLPRRVYGVAVGINWGRFWPPAEPTPEQAFMAGYLYRKVLEVGGLPFCYPQRALEGMLAIPPDIKDIEFWDAARRMIVAGATPPPESSPDLIAAMTLGLVASWSARNVRVA